MSKTQVTTVVVMLLHAALAREHGLAHRRFSHVNDVGDFSFPKMLSERDECTDLFGDGATLSYCPPSSTACCVFDGQSLPSCQQYLGKGWCCAGDGEGDKCYVDQVSVCEEDSSVACTRLAKGTSNACCPKLTTCDPDSDAAEDSVRCIINWTDLVVADAAQKSKDAQSQTTSSATSSSTSTTTTTTTSAVSTTSSESNESKESEKPPAEEDKNGSGGVSGGVIAGAVVGSLAGLALIGALVFFLMRRRREAKYEAANQAQPTSPRLSSDMTANVVTFPPKILSPHDPGYVYAPPPSELDGSYTFAELDATREPQQLDSTSVIAQLDSTAPQRDLMSPLRETSSPQLDSMTPQRELGPTYMDSASHQRDWSVSQLSSASPQRDSSTSQLGPTNIPQESTISQLEPTTTPQQQTPKP